MAKLHYFLSFLSLFFHLSFSLTIGQYQIRDLERDSDSFAAEAKLWQITNKMGSSLYTTCNGDQILGGYNVAGTGAVMTRTYSGLSSHNVIQFSIAFWVLDLATSTDLFQIYFDSTLVGKWDSSNYDYNNLGGTNICGGSNVDYPYVTVEGSVPHTASTLTVKIVSLATSTPSTTTTSSSSGGVSTTITTTTMVPAFTIGIRDVNLLLKTSSSTPSLSICKFVSFFDTSSSSCFCQSGYYDPVGYYWCSKCNTACASCTSSGAGDCTACASGYYFSGSKCASCDSSCAECSGSLSTQCTACASGKYLYWDGTCKSSCDSPLVKGTENSTSTCSLPCDDGEFYYQNGTCESACSSPFVESSDGDLELCNFICDDDEFYNWNGVCQETCDEPFIQNLKGVERYCEKPCGDTNYLYENNTCEATCEYPFVEDDSEGYLQCNFICEHGGLLNWQDTCQHACDSPFIQELKGTERYCLKPCGDDGFLYANNTCTETCDSPFVEGTENGYKTCNFPCESDEFWAWDDVCQTTCDDPFVQVTQGVEKYCNSPCPLTDYLYENVTCQDSCASNFFEVDVRNIKYCNFSCDHFMYWNNTCQENCETPLVQILEGVERYCRPPCEEDEFYYENGTCSDSCEAPFLKGNNGDFATCEKPCSELEFLYWNGSCLDSCPSLFRAKVEGVRICSFHCNDGLYQYWNDSCLSTCDSPLTVTENEDYKYCQKPCDEGEYLYSNGTCLTECNYQIVVDQNGVSNCIFPCGSQEYLYQNDTCKSSCPSPYEASTSSDNFLLCDSPCDSDEYYRQELASCVSHCSFPLTIRTEGVLNICENTVTSGNNSTDDDSSNSTSSVLTALAEELENLAASFSSLANAASEACSFIRPNDPNSGFVISSAKSTKHIKLLDLSIYVEANTTTNSSRILEEDDSDDDSAFSLTSMFTYKMPKSLKSRFESQTLPTALQGKVLHSSFLVNFWESMTTFMSLIVLGIFFIICDFIAKKTKRPVLMAFMQKLRTLTEWNFVIFVFLNCYDDITLYTIVELKTLKLDSFYAIISFIVCLSFCFVGLYLLYKIIKITKDSLKLNRQVVDAKATIGPEEEFCKKYSKYQVMHVGYENTSFWKQAFLLFYVGKIVLSYIIIGCLYNYPVVQTSLLTSLSVLMIFYLIKTKPTYDKFHLLIILIFEVLALVTNICMIILAVLSTKGATHIALQERLARIIVIADLANGLAASFVLWAYVLMAIYTAFKKTREPGIESKTAWLNVLVAPFQPPGMEYYEEEDTMASEEDIEKGLKPRKRRRIRPSRRKVFKNKVQPAVTLVKYELDSMNVLPQDDTLTTGSRNPARTTPPGRVGSMPTLQAFLRIESDSEALDQDFTPVLSPDSSGIIHLPPFSPGSGGPQLSPIRRELLKSGESGYTRKSQFSRLRTPTQGPMMTLERYLPSVIIEETSPGNRKGDEFEPETPDFHQKVKALVDREETHRENTLLKSRGLTRLRKIPTGQSAESDISLDYVIESKPRYNHSDSDHESTKAFSKMVRTWKNRTSQEEGGLGSTLASINSDLLSNLDDKGSSARGFLRSDRRRRLTENLSRSSGKSDLLRSRESAGSGSGPVSLRGSPQKNSVDEGDLMFVTNYDEGEKRNSAYGTFNYKGHF